MPRSIARACIIVDDIKLFGVIDYLLEMKAWPRGFEESEKN